MIHSLKKKKDVLHATKMREMILLLRNTCKHTCVNEARYVWLGQECLHTQKQYVLHKAIIFHMLGMDLIAPSCSLLTSEG